MRAGVLAEVSPWPARQQEIVIADVVRDMEDDLNLVECFCDEGSCVIKPM